MRDSAQQQTEVVNMTGWAQLVGQIMLMPVSIFVYGVDLLKQTVGQMQNVTAQSMSATRVTAQTFGEAQAESSPADVTGSHKSSNRTDKAETSKQATREEEKMSDQTWNSGDEVWTTSEACREKDPCDRLRLVRYKVLFLRDKLEVAFPEDEELVAEDITKDGFISWKVAEFIQRMQRREVRQPRKWFEKNNYPENDGGSVKGEYPESYVTDLPDKDKKYLRVYSDVLAWYDREKKNYEREKVDALEEIRNALQGITLSGGYAPGGGSGTGGAAAGSTTHEKRGRSNPTE